VIDISKEYGNTEIPPLTLQMLIENIINQNILTQSQPLDIYISVVNNQIEITHNVQPKLYGGKENEEAIENIANKFRLLTQREIRIIELNEKKIIRLPLLEQKEYSTI
jgi:LytS/YehU family sensor histidine kinase